MSSLSKFSAGVALAIAIAWIAAPSAHAQSAPLPTSIASPTPAQDALRNLLAETPSPLPIGTKLRSVTIVNGLATANFSHELRDNFHGGDTEEAQTVNAILKTLGAFPTVERVQILVEGSPVDSLGGLLSISEPLPVIRSDSGDAAQPIRRFHRKARR